MTENPSTPSEAEPTAAPDAAPSATTEGEALDPAEAARRAEALEVLAALNASAAPLDRSGSGRGAARSGTGATGRTKRPGMRERSTSQSWARGLTLMGAGLAVLAMLSTITAALMDVTWGRVVAMWVGTVLVLVAGSRARRADEAGSDTVITSTAPLMAAGLAVFFLGPVLVSALG